MTFENSFISNGSARVDSSLPKVSVIIPTFNRSSQLVRAIDSVFEQTFRDFEVIVVDDGSTDNTREALNPYMGRIRYAYQLNGGASAARNLGLKIACGTWIATLDSDDLWEARKLEQQLGALAVLGNAAVCFTDCRFFGDPMITETSFEAADLQCEEPFGLVDHGFRYMIGGRFAFCVQSMLVLRQLLIDVGGFDDHLKLNEDRELVFRLSFKTKFCAIPDALVRVDRSPKIPRLTDACSERTDEVFEWNERVWQTMLANPCLDDPAIRESLRHELMNVYYDGAAWKAQAMKLRSAWTYLARIHKMRTSYPRIFVVIATRAMKKALRLHQPNHAARNSQPGMI